MAHWSSKRKMYMTASLIYQNMGPGAQPCGQEVVQSSKGGGMNFMEWAFDVRKCAGEEIHIMLLDDYYVTESSEYSAVPRHLSPVLRVFWKNMKRRRLIGTGERIVQALYEEEYIYC